RIQTANALVQLLFLVVARLHLIQAAIQQSQWVRDRVRRLPFFQLARLDLRRQIVQQRKCDRVPADRKAQFGHLHFAGEPGSSGTFPNEFAAEEFDALLRPSFRYCLGRALKDVRQRFGTYRSRGRGTMPVAGTTPKPASQANVSGLADAVSSIS